MLNLTLPGKAIMSIFSPPKPKPIALPKPAPALPKRKDPVVQDKKTKQMALNKRRRGIGDNILTSGLGVSEKANVRKPSLLGEVKRG